MELLTLGYFIISKERQMLQGPDTTAEQYMTSAKIDTEQDNDLYFMWLTRISLAEVGCESCLITGAPRTMNISFISVFPVLGTVLGS